MKFSVPAESGQAFRSRALPEAAMPLRVLVVSDNEQSHVFVRHLLTKTGWMVCSRFSVSEAAALVEADQFQVVLCDRDAPSGCWQKLLEVCNTCERPPRLIVFSRFADVALWAEVLNLGAYDLLMYPFETQEVIRTTTLAWESWRREGPRKNRAAAAGNSAGCV